MDAQAFQAQRREDLRASDDRLSPIVEKALLDRSDPEWYASIVDEAGKIWVEFHQAEAPGANFQSGLDRFKKAIGDSLSKTSENTNAGRVTRWATTFTVNDGTVTGAYARGIRYKMWRTMEDGDVREVHRSVDGQLRRIGGLFDLGDVKMPYPGAPVGPGELWAECRCVVQAASREGEAMSTNTFAIAAEEVIEEVVDEEVPVGEADEEDEDVTEIPVHGVATIEGKATGDGREFARGALTHRMLPLPLRLEIIGTHGGDTSDVVSVGRIDEMWRQEGDEYNEYRYRGVIITTKQYAAQAVEGIVDGSLTGVSVETDSTVRDPGHEEARETALQKVLAGEALSDEENVALSKDVYSESRVCGFTIVPIPAFEEAYIGLGQQFADELDEECLECAEEAATALDSVGEYRVVDLAELTEDELAAYDVMSVEKQEAYEDQRGLIVASAFAPGTKDGPGWITDPIPTGRIRKYWVSGEGAAKIRWGAPGAFNRCRKQLAKYIANPEWLAGACANMYFEATGRWPGRKRGDKGMAASAAPLFTLTAAAIREYPADWFTMPTLEDPRVGVVVDGDRVYGYIAQWGVCHIGIEGVCTTAPPSETNYAYFATGFVHTDDGNKVRVGQITIDTGHANLNASAKAAAAHYDNTGAAAADVAVGEDGFGIWFAGALRSSISDDNRHALEASGRVSGDWRVMMGGGLELIAALAVNVPGFPIPAQAGFAASAGVQTSLIAAGVVMPEVHLVSDTAGAEEANLAFAADLVEKVVARLEDKKREQDVRSRLEEMQLADARRRLNERI